MVDNGEVLSVAYDEKNEDEEEYYPSISDQLYIGYTTMDRACQTQVSEIVNLKNMANVLSALQEDLIDLKKTMHYAKITLQSEYDGRLKEAVTELYRRVSLHMVEVGRVHKERLEVVRRSYKTQLSNALCKLSRDYHNYYGNRDASSQKSHLQKLKEMEKQHKSQRQNEIAQQEMFEMMKMQMEEAKLRAVEDLSRRSSVVSTSMFTQEIDELQKTVREYEGRVDYLEDMLEETNNDNTTLNREIESLTHKLSSEEKKTGQLAEEIASLHSKVEMEKQVGEQKLLDERKKLQEEMKKQLNTVKNKMHDDAQKKIDEIRNREAEKMRSQKEEEGRRLEEPMVKQETERKPVEIPMDTDVRRLHMIEKKQRAEIARLNKELERTVHLWEMKVKILQEHIHALKDEMFLRTTLQRQMAKVKPAAVTYVKRGLELVPLGIKPTDEVTTNLTRTHRLPTIVQAPRTPPQN